MKIYWAKFDTDGLPLAFYVSDLWPTPPDGVVEITQDQWREFIDTPGLRRWDGFKVVVYDPPQPPEPEPRLVRKAIIINRLYAAGKLEAADEILKSMSLYDRQRWEVRDAVYFNDPTLLAALNAIGADPGVIMASE